MAIGAHPSCSVLRSHEKLAVTVWRFGRGKHISSQQGDVKRYNQSARSEGRFDMRTAQSRWLGETVNQK